MVRFEFLNEPVIEREGINSALNGWFISCLKARKMIFKVESII